MDVESSIEYPYKLLCMGCLCFGRTLQPLREDKLKQCYVDIIKEIPLYSSPIKCLSLCLECSALLQKVVSFRDQLQNCYRILQAYTGENLTEFLLSDVIRPPRLRIHTLDPVDIASTVPTDTVTDVDDEVSVKQEYKNEYEYKEVEVEIETNPLKPAPELRERKSSDSVDDNNLKPMDSGNDEDVHVKDELKIIERDEDIHLDDPHSDAPASDNEKNIEKQIHSLLVEIKKDRARVKKRKKHKTKAPKETPVTLDLDRKPYEIITIELTYEQMIEEREKEAKKDLYIRAEFKCDSCLMGFHYKNSYLTHMATKHSPDNGKYSCIVCQSVFPTVESFQSHYKRHTRRYECGLCQKRALDIKVMEQHYYTAHQISLKKYSCPMCAHVSNSIDMHRYHKDSHKARLECPECDKTFTHRAGLLNHRLAVHELHNSFPCSICKKVFRWKTSLKRHLDKHDKNKPAQSAAHCSECKISFSSVCSYKRHLRNSLKHVAKDQRKYVCDHCNKRFADKTKIRDHIEEKHLHKTYQCHICNKPSKNRVGLDQHVRNVHQGRPNNKMCHVCGKGFPTKVQLESHIRTHTGERPFICEFCPTMFSQQSNLYKHNRQVHLNMKSKRRSSQPPATKSREEPPKETAVAVADDANRCTDVDIPIEAYRPNFYTSDRYM